MCIAVPSALVMLLSMSPEAADAPAEVIEAFGLVGTWSPNCDRDPPPERLWEFRVGDGGRAVFQETAFSSPYRKFLFFEVSPLSIRIWNLDTATHIDGKNIFVEMWPAGFFIYNDVSLLHFSRSWFALRIPTGEVAFIPDPEAMVLGRDGRSIKVSSVPYGWSKRPSGEFFIRCTPG